VESYLDKKVGTGTGSTTLRPQETLTAVLGEELMPGSATVLFTFTGILNDKLCGFYRSKYTVNGEDRWAGLLVL
jgi:puromycin-sensitive aminopeptidase